MPCRFCGSYVFIITFFYYREPSEAICTDCLAKYMTPFRQCLQKIRGLNNCGYCGENDPEGDYENVENLAMCQRCIETYRKGLLYCRKAKVCKELSDTTKRYT